MTHTTGRTVVGHWAFMPAVTCVVGVVVACLPAAHAQAPMDVSAAGGDVMRGWRTLYDKQCVDCHAVWGQGGRVGPDLGRIRTGRLSDGQLAGVMWNHIPKMLGQMRQTGHAPTTLTQVEMSDLFALMFFVRQLDEPGDPVRGEGILQRKGCSECHTTDSSEDGIGPDLAKWGQYANPVVWARVMWEHAPLMEEAMKREDMGWPELEGTDLVHIVAYIRSVGRSGDKTYLRPGSVANGKTLFLEKKCDSCHPGSGPDLTEVELPTSMGALASRMWNHSPEMARVMREQDVERLPLSSQELADILAYVLALGNRDRGGDPGLGQKVFAQKGCGQCHESGEVAEAGGPPIQALGQDASPVNMAAAMWNHGASMLEQMTEAGIAWPVFNDREMVDLLAYLNAAQSDSAVDE